MPKHPKRPTPKPAANPSPVPRRAAASPPATRDRLAAAQEHATAGLAGLAADFAALRAMDDEDVFAGPPDDQRRIDYLPTPTEIIEACASIRRGWTVSEKRRRFVGDDVPDDENRDWQPPVIDTSHFRLSSRVGVDSAL